ncbi:hypothetical protein C8R43DRAFT_458456 [Mycena crocata]|nr:hypothetical protein C8R43DRAFT_458456 [Mycena crocata]
MPPTKDTEPGFGRRNGNDDSSSSRESSPVRKHKRSFSPTSDDEVVISIADDDTPPPEGPLIRQAVAFSWTPSIPATAPASINTYQASPIPTQQHNTFFLPGQEVPAPPPPPKEPKPPKTKKKSAPRFSSQTNRFRVNSYDPTPDDSTPPLTSGTGPYTSMYRATPPYADMQPGPFDHSLSDAPSTNNRKRSKPSVSRPKASTSKAKVTASKAKPSASKSKASDPNQGSFDISSNMTRQAVSAQEERAASYYRRDYEQGTHVGYSTSQLENPSSPRVDLQRLPANKRNLPLRLVTVLIEDLRGEVPDSQLVEVRAVLRDSENTERDGYWANAQDICQTLQASPSRIDGPAKVYSFRGKYRQIILKVTADNVDEWVTANVVVNPDRTLEMVVETGLPPTALVQPPRARREVSDPYMSPRPAAQLPYTDRGSGSPTYHEHSSRKRRLSPSDDHRGRSNRSRQWSPSTMVSSPRRTPSQGPSTSYAHNIPISSARMASSAHHPDPVGKSMDRPTYAHSSYQRPARSESESDSDDSGAKHDQVVREVDELIQQDSTWVEYFKISAKPRSAANVLKEYRIVQGFIDKWTGKQTPSGSLIETSHIAQALQIDQKDCDKYMSDCSETLHLIGLYGAEGQRLQDPDVGEKAKDETEPSYNEKPIKRLLRLLRQVDEKWLTAHPSEPA